MSAHRNTKRRVFLTGATGAMGIPITKELRAAGHEVIGLARSPEAVDLLRDLDAQPVQADIFDPAALASVMAGADTVAHFATSIPTGAAASSMNAWGTNDRLRTEGTAALIAAAREADVPRFIFESISLAYPDRGSEWIDESVPLAPVAPMMETAVQSEAMLAGHAANGAEVVVLRFGRLYGPGRASAALVEAVAHRRMPIVGRGNNFVSSIHSDDVGSAVLAALDLTPATYNVVDDEPCTQREVLEALATSLRAPAPRTLPRPLARAMFGKVTNVLTVSHRVSNRKFREAANWRPAHRSAVASWPRVVQVPLRTREASR